MPDSKYVPNPENSTKISEAEKYDALVSSDESNRNVKPSDALRASTLWEELGELKKAYEVLERATSVLGFWGNKSYPEIYEALDNFVKKHGLYERLNEKAKNEWDKSISTNHLPTSHHDIVDLLNS